MRDGVVVGLLVPLAYLLGTLPSAEIAARRRGIDITAAGSGNPGASNTFRVLGWRSGVLVFALDAAKGGIAAGVGLLVADGHVGAYVLGIAAIIGHTFPITRHFKGGRGVATGAGVLFVIFPLLTLASGVVWFVIVRLTHKASLASIVVVIMFPIAVALAGHPAGDVTVIAAVAVLVVARHASNLKRLFRGEELGLDPGTRDDTGTRDDSGN
ncbi:MAG: glycerol-3-phosphate 1-O-acyltransferase PlsY [Acidimicrobiia bacterium]